MDYIPINNHSGRGKIGISRRAISSIVYRAIDDVSGASLDKKSSTPLARFLGLVEPIKVVLSNDGKAKITLNVNISAKDNVSEVCLALQKEIASKLTMAIDTVPYDISVNIVSLI